MCQLYYADIRRPSSASHIKHFQMYTSLSVTRIREDSTLCVVKMKFARSIMLSRYLIRAASKRYVPEYMGVPVEHLLRNTSLLGPIQALLNKRLNV